MLFKRSEDLDNMVLDIHLRGLGKQLKKLSDKHTNSTPVTIQNALSIVENTGLTGNTTPGYICGYTADRNATIGAVNTGSYIFFNKDHHEVKVILESVKHEEKKVKTGESVLIKMAASRMESIHRAMWSLEKASRRDWELQLRSVAVPEIKTLQGAKDWLANFRNKVDELRIYIDANREVRELMRFLDRADLTDDIIAQGHNLYVVKIIHGE